MRKHPEYPNVTICDHPVSTAWLTIARNEKTDSPTFRRMISQISMLLAADVFADLPQRNVVIRTPIEATRQPVLDASVALVPIYRAGEQELDGFWKVFPQAPVWHLGMMRNEKFPSRQKVYLNKLPERITVDLIVNPDIMLATGGTQCRALGLIKKRIVNVKNMKTKIRVAAVIAAPEGLKRVSEAHPDVEIFVVAVDRCLNEKRFIMPGLGGAGERCYNTEN